MRRLRHRLAALRAGRTEPQTTVAPPSRVLGALAGIVAWGAAAGVALVMAAAPALAALAVGASVASDAVAALPADLPDDDVALPTTLYVKSASGEGWTELARFFDQDRRPVGFDDVAPVVYDAIVSSEDPRFWEHHGVDVLGTARAVAQNVAGGRELQGGSTITQQYVKNLQIEECRKDARSTEAEDGCYRAATSSSGESGMRRKLREMKTALSMERTKGKQQILVGYLNIANFGGTTSGIEAAARRYFSVSASDLTLGQAAALVGIVQNPNRFRLDRPDGTVMDGGKRLNAAPDGVVEPAGGGLGALTRMRDDGRITQEQYVRAADGYTQTKGRQLYVLGRMRAEGRITRAQYEQAALEPIEPVVSSSPSGCESAGARAYFCEYVRASLLQEASLGSDPRDRERALSRAGLAVYTTLDPAVQEAAEQAMSAYVPSAVPGMDLGATAVSTEVGTGRVIALVQNTRFSVDPRVTAEPGNRALVYAVAATAVLGVADLSPLRLAAQFGTTADTAWAACAADPIDRIVDPAGRTLSGDPRPCTSAWGTEGGAGAVDGDWGAGETYSAAIPDAARPQGPTPIVGRHGVDGHSQSMIVETSSRVTTLVWVGNATGQADLSASTFGGLRLSQLRYPVVAAVQTAANAAYGGSPMNRR